MSDVRRIAVPHLRLVFGGTLGPAAQEIWACGLKLVAQNGPNGSGVFAPTQGPGGALLAGLLADATADISGIVDTGGSGGPNLGDALSAHMVPAVKTLFQSVGRTDASLSYVKLNAFGADDLQANATTVEQQFAPIPGPNSATVPYSTAVVAEWRSSNRSRGFASHGRMMFPAGVSMSTTGKISSIGAHNAGGAGLLISDSSGILLDFLAALNFESQPSGAGSGTSRQYIPSIVYTGLPDHVYKSAGARPPTFSPIDRCFWSDIPGEVRRRQNKLKQGSSQSTVTYGAAS